MEDLNFKDTSKEKLRSIIFRSDTPAGKLFDIVLLVLIVLSITLVFLESVVDIRLSFGNIIRIAEWTFTILFTLEYLLRIYCSGKRFSYIFSFYGIIDLIAFLPSYLSLFFPGGQYLMVIRAVRLLRVFRIMKLTRFMNEGNVLGRALKASSHKIIVFLTCVLTLVTIIGTLMYIIEGDDTGFTSIPVSIYWAIVTITTVGYGDISPQSTLGQLLASVLMILGYGIIAVPTGIVSVEMARATEEAKRKCPGCNAAIHTLDDCFCAKCGTALEPAEYTGQDKQAP
ncbi:ion transporter [Pedobacter sp. SL55]|uniref:ion transporter n=1 Tax=Pedobacter sp. SL55 TaxID=2995161 RepID=UPI00226E1EB5|nr:ion transporter [Pedobacter sp. SL55]WAC39542.1 ion transporter [Pedobacter sp. SL55]